MEDSWIMAFGLAQLGSGWLGLAWLDLAWLGSTWLGLAPCMAGSLSAPGIA